jgi:GWxTD domain-containing protein
MRPIPAVALITLFLAVSAFAGVSEAYKNWPNTPEGYFLTKAERAEWDAIQDDEAAKQFVEAFQAKRGGAKFVAEVKKRTEMADKYLSIGKVKGSTTTRGKIVILFGAPANIDIKDRPGRTNYVSGPSSEMSSDLGVGASATGADGSSTRIGTAEAGRIMKDYTFTFSSKSVPAIGDKDYSIVVEVDAGTGKDRIKDKKKQAEL